MKRAWIVSSLVLALVAAPGPALGAQSRPRTDGATAGSAARGLLLTSDQATWRGTIDARRILKPVSRPATLRAPGKGGSRDGGATPIAPRTTSPNVVVSPPAPVLSTAFAGLDDQNAGPCTPMPERPYPCLDPASSSVAVGPGDVVQVANEAIQVTDRSGAEPLTASLSDFFAAPVPGATAEPNVLYDQNHHRWLAAESSWDCNDSPAASFIDLMVSRTADPRGTWDLYAIGSTSVFLTLDSIGTSSDKVALVFRAVTLNVAACVPGSGNTGGGFVALDWASLKVPAAASVPIATSGLQTWVDPVGAVAQGTTTDPTLYVVAKNGTDAFLARVKGSAVAKTATETDTDLTTLGLPAFVNMNGVPQNGLVVGGFGDSFDDAVVQGGHLWLSRTIACLAPADPLTDCVEVAEFGVAAPPSVPTLRQDFSIGVGAAADAFMGGLAVDGNGTLHVVYSQEQSGGAITDSAVYQRTVDPVDSFSTSATLRTSDATYDGGNWGQYPGMAPDPTDSSAVWEAVPYADADGGWATQVGQLTVPHDVTRLSGTDRYATSAAISSASVAPGVAAVFIATGANFPDALSGASPAAIAGDPLLLVNGAATSIPLGSPVDRELLRLTPTTIYILGGLSSVSAGIAAQLQGYVGGDPSHVIRVFGTDRYDTAKQVALRFFPTTGGHVYIALGTNFPDALSAAPAAAVNHAPLLLTAATVIPQPTKDALAALQPADITILGSVGGITPAVETALAAYVGGDASKVHRLGGSDRYETALAVSTSTFLTPPYEAFIASGTNFPDALGGAALAGHTGGPLLLVGGSLTTDEKAELTRLQPPQIDIFGGPSGVSETVRVALHLYLQ